eukprot:5785878-Pleurochrysis_carterae.AAC.1
MRTDLRQQGRRDVQRRVAIVAAEDILHADAVRHEGGEAGGAHVLVVRVDNLLRAQAHEERHLGRDAHADGHRLAMQQRLATVVPRQVLDRVADGVA